MRLCACLVPPLLLCPLCSMKRSGIEPNETIFYFIFEGLFKSKRYDVAHDVWRTVRNTLLFEPEEVRDLWACVLRCVGENLGGGGGARVSQDCACMCFGLEAS